MNGDEFPEVTGELVAACRAALKLSRDAFARLVGLSPGAVWRLENKNKFKPGEVAHLLAVADRWLVDQPACCPPPAPVQHASADPAPILPAALVDPAIDEYGELVQWLDHESPTLAVTAKPLGDGTFAYDVGGKLVGFITKTPETASAFTAPAVDPVITRTATWLDALRETRMPTPSELTARDGVLRVSNSEVQSFKDCPRRWWLSYFRGLRPKLESPVGPRAVGVRGHAALRAQYVGPGEVATDARDALERLIVEDWTRLTRAYEESEFLGGSVPAELAKKFTQDADLERIILDGYAEWVAETGVDTDLEFTGSERYLEAELTLPGRATEVRIVGRLDVRVRRKTDGSRLFVDHKFVGSLSRPLLTLTLDEQLLWYMVLERLQPDEHEPVSGALYNMLRRVKRTAGATPPFYQRVEVHHNERELASFTRRTRATLLRLVETREALDRAATESVTDTHLDVAPPRPTQDCSWRCPFVRVCPMFDDGSRVEAALREHFVTGDPYSYYSPDATQEVMTT